MALRSDILAESRQKGAGNMSTEPVRMSRHVMWHERRAVQQKNRGRLSGKRGIFPVKQQMPSMGLIGRPRIYHPDRPATNAEYQRRFARKRAEELCRLRQKLATKVYHQSQRHDWE